MHCDLDLWPFDRKIDMAHHWLLSSLCVKFHDERCKGKVVMRTEPFYLTARLQTDRRTDGRTDRVIPVYPPPNFVAGGIISFLWVVNIVYTQQRHLQRLSRRGIYVTTCKILLLLFCLWTSCVTHSDYLVLILKFYTVHFFKQESTFKKICQFCTAKIRLHFSIMSQLR